MIVHTLGDVHLGKKFEHGVPLHRRGDRERMQFAQFRADLDTPCDLHIQVGDLFDKMHVPYTVIYEAYRAYKDARMRNPNTTYVVMRGNHDASRDADKVSAFQVFTAMVRPLGIVVADDHAVEIGDHVVIPWHPFKTAIEMLPDDLTGMTVYGHWDIVMGDTNQLPAAELKARGAVRAVTGHDHNARDLELDGLPITVTGSMQPYSHSEDPEGVLYITTTLDELPADVRDKCVRLVLGPDEQLVDPIDCLQLQVTRQKEEATVDLGEIQFEAFDFNALYAEVVGEVGLTEAMATKAMIKLEELRAERA